MSKQKETEIRERQPTGAERLTQQLDVTCGLLADDMDKINSGVTDGLKILSLDEEALKKILFVVKNKDAFLGTVNKGGRPPKLDKKEVSSDDEAKEELPPEKEVGNPFEFFSDKVKKKLNGAER